VPWNRHLNDAVYWAQTGERKIWNVATFQPQLQEFRQNNKAYVCLQLKYVAFVSIGKWNFLDIFFIRRIDYS
jgi:hypothetical protein